MEKVRLKRDFSEPRPPSAGTNGAHQLKPLQVSGLVVSRDALVEALRAYVPSLVDIQVTEDGRHFWLMLDASGASPNTQ